MRRVEKIARDSAITSAANLNRIPEMTNAYLFLVNAGVDDRYTHHRMIRGIGECAFLAQKNADMVTMRQLVVLLHQVVERAKTKNSLSDSYVLNAIMVAAGGIRDSRLVKDTFDCAVSSGLVDARTYTASISALGYCGTNIETDVMPTYLSALRTGCFDRSTERVMLLVAKNSGRTDLLADISARYNIAATPTVSRFSMFPLPSCENTARVAAVNSTIRPPNLSPLAAAFAPANPK